MLLGLHSFWFLVKMLFNCCFICEPFQKKELEALLQRGEEMDVMLMEKEKRLEEKEAYIVHLQTGLSGEKPSTPVPEHGVCRSFCLHIFPQEL